ncbi:MAG TPA: hypothetical protein VHQ43_04300 [Solirubrobacterales bacterium]|jgi:hypothetical protein|nr:hypothetical protein [Solirubrobacterales bacterium]
MSLFAAWVVYPLVLLALCVGLGLLVDVLAGRRLPGALVPPVGLAALIVVAQFTTWSEATSELTVPLICFLAVLGVGFSLPWRFGRPDLWAVGVALAVFAVFAAPIVLSGHPTFAGYIKLDDTATWFALTDRVMDHGGRSLSGLEPSSYHATLEFNLAGGYPVGVFLPFGTAQKLVGGDLAWVFQPYVTFLAAMLSLGIWQIAGGLLRQPARRALVAFVAAQPALLFGYAMWGGVKEVAAAVFIVLAAALAPVAVRDDALRRDAALLALAAGALVGVLSAGGLIWLGPMLLVLAFFALRNFPPRDAALQALAFVVPLGLLVLPVVSSGLVPPTSSPLTDAHAEGNLRGPLNALQVLGIWPAGDFRFDPDGTIVTAVLIALTIAAAAVALLVAWRKRHRKTLLYASALLACAVIVIAGSPWAGGKALATASPVALSLAIAGAVLLLRADRPTGLALIVVVAGGVLWSNLLAYGGADLAPYGQLRELEQIGHEFAGEGPTLMTEYNPYGARHFLRLEDGEGASELRTRPVPLRGGGEVEKGYAVDTDELDLNGLLEFRTLVLRRSPVRSRPPSPYRLVRSGKYYEVWQRREGFTGPVPEHLPYGDESNPVAVPECSEIGGIGLLAIQNQSRDVRLIAAHHAPVFDATDGNLQLPRAGEYAAWLEGSVRGAVSLYVDGEEFGEARQELENEGSFVPMGEAHLDAGRHEVELRFGGADLHPGSGGFPRPETGPLLFAPTGEEAGRLISVPVAESNRLCGKAWDWIEAVGVE